MLPINVTKLGANKTETFRSKERQSDSVKLELRPELAVRYKSLSQRARVLTEAWAEENLYCVNCASDQLEPAPPGEKVVDFTCPECPEEYQLKSKSKPFGYSVSNSAYAPKIERIKKKTNPNYLFLHYDLRRYTVDDLFLVPRYFMSPSLVEERKPLTQNARRKGWVGSNILLGRLPADARISIVENGAVIPRPDVRTAWGQFRFLRDQTILSRGWLTDILSCVRRLDRDTFSLADMYRFEEELARLHPRNRYIRPKIRQQLQVLRDHGVVEFLGRGTYRVRKQP